MRLVIKSRPTASRTSRLSSFLLATCAPATESPCMFLEHATLWRLCWKRSLRVDHCSLTRAPNIHRASSFPPFRLFPSCQLSSGVALASLHPLPLQPPLPHLTLVPLSLTYSSPYLSPPYALHPNIDFASGASSFSSCSTVSSTRARIPACFLCSCSRNNTWHIVETEYMFVELMPVVTSKGNEAQRIEMICQTGHR